MRASPAHPAHPRLRQASLGVVTHALAVACGLPVTASHLSAEPLTVESLHRYGSAYHLHAVSLEGIVQEMVVFPPVWVSNPDGCTIYGAARFTLEDPTGKIAVDVPGTCLPAFILLPRDGDRIRLDAIIHVTPTHDRATPALQAVARRLTIVEDPERE